MDWSERKKLIAAEVSDLVLKFGYEDLDKRFLKDHGCRNLMSDEEMHEVSLAREYHNQRMKDFPNNHKVREEEPYRCYHKTVCTCGFSEACDSSD